MNIEYAKLTVSFTSNCTYINSSIAAGPKGRPGSMGKLGNTGPAGLTGPSGDSGPPGFPGATGDQGQCFLRSCVLVRAPRDIVVLCTLGGLLPGIHCSVTTGLNDFGVPQVALVRLADLVLPAASAAVTVSASH